MAVRWLTLVVFFLPAAAPAGINGMIEGVVRDRATGEALPGVNVRVADQPQGASTDATGYFRIHNVRAGTYALRFTYIGYATHVVNNIVVYPDLRTRVNVSLEPSDVELEEISVVQERPLIQHDLPSTTYSISEAKIDKLPVSSFQEVLSLQPGTTIEGNVRGGKTNEVVYLVDGLPVQDVIGGGIGMSLPKSSITRMMVHTGGFDAEYGNAMSGVVNVITRSGSRTPSYGARVERDVWLPERWHKQHNRTTEVELTAAGPVGNEKLFYFTANTLNISGTRWWQDFQRFDVSPVHRELLGFAKLEYELDADMRIGVQGMYAFRKWHDYEYSWRFNLAGLPLRQRDSYRLGLTFSQSLAAGTHYNLTLSRFSLNSLISERRKDQLPLIPYQYDFYLRYVVAGERNWWADVRQIVYTLKGDVSAQIGRSHVLKSGFELNAFDLESDVLKYEPQTTYFGKPILDAELLNFSNRYSYRPRSGSVFLQNKVEIVEDGSNFSIGIRWDFFDPTAERPLVEFVPVRPEEYDQVVTGFAKARFKHQVSPRLAFAAPAGPNTFFFINFGHYFQFPIFDQLYSGVTPQQLRQGTRNIRVGNPDLEPERTIAWEVGVKYALTRHHLVTATYFRKAFRNQIDTKTLIPFDSKAAGDYGFAEYVNNANADAHGIEVVLSQERGEHISGSISYSYMVTEGISEYADQALNLAQWGFPLAVQPFPLSWDQRHTLKADAEFDLFAGIHVNVILLYNSPRPYTFYPTRDGFVPLDTTKAFLPNNRRMKEVFFLHAKASRVFSLPWGGVVSLYADARNILNGMNVRWMDSSGRIGGELGDPGAYYEPRRVNIGARYEW